MVLDLVNCLEYLHFPGVVGDAIQFCVFRGSVTGFYVFSVFVLPCWVWDVWFPDFLLSFGGCFVDFDFADFGGFCILWF